MFVNDLFFSYSHSQANCRTSLFARELLRFESDQSCIIGKLPLHDVDFLRVFALMGEPN